MKLEHAKSALSPIQGPRVFRGAANPPFVPAQGLSSKDLLSPHPRPLSTAVLARTTGKLPKHHASASAKSRDFFGSGDFTAIVLSYRTSELEQPHPYAKSVSSTSSKSLLARTAGDHSHEERKETVA